MLLVLDKKALYDALRVTKVRKVRIRDWLVGDKCGGERLRGWTRAALTQKAGRSRVRQVISRLVASLDREWMCVQMLER
jgi:hypothetical protein